MRYLLIIFILFYQLIAGAQPGISSIEKYTTAEGLSNNEITTIFQDQRGFLWIATSWGLNRYDGRSFKQYIKTNTGDILDNITSLAEDEKGQIWIGTSRQVKIFDPLTEKITERNFKGHVFADREKNMWVVDKGLLFFTKRGEIIKKISLDINPPEAWRNHYSSRLFEDAKGNIWIPSSKGVIRLDKNSFTVKNYFTEDKNKQEQNACTTVYEDEQGIIWAGSWGGGLLKYDPVHDRFNAFLLNQKIRSPENIIYSITDYKYNNTHCLLLGTETGLTILQKPSDPNHVLIEKTIGKGEHDQELNAFAVTDIFHDRQGNFWLATAAGLHKVDKSKQNLNWVYLPAKNTNDIVFHVVEDIHHPDSILYLTSMNGWWKLNLQNQSLEKFLRPKLSSQLTGYINQYIKDKNGIWFTSQLGIGYFDLEKNNITDFTYLINPKKNGSIRTWFIAKDPFGKIWFSVFRNGLRIFDPVTKKIQSLFVDTTADNLSGTPIEGMLIDDSGTVWMKTAAKLYRINSTDHSYVSFPAVPGKLYVDKQKRLLVYNDRNIFQFINSQFHPLYPLHGVADFRITALNEDDRGNFWINTHNDFFKVSADFKKWTSYKSYTGFDKNSMYEFYNRGDHFIATTAGKILDFNTKDLNLTNTPVSIFVSRIQSNEKSFFFPSSAGNMKFSYKSRIAIELSVLNFLNEKGNKIFYQLKGWDNKWNELSAGNTLYYEQLPPGNYDLLIKATNGNTLLSSEPVHFAFIIKHPFWQTWWFITLCILAVSSSLYFIYRYRLQQALKIERLRTRIATDLHDDIGSTLSSISMYSEAVKKQVKDKLPQLENVLDKMGENSRKMVSSMSDIVWAVNPGNDHGKKLLERMEAYAKDACSVTETKLDFICSNDVQSFNFSLEFRKNIYLIFKEALNNALKYADAGNVWVYADRKGSNFNLIINDNGKGFDTGSEFNGNGLKNIATRAKEIKADIDIQSGFQGTKITLSCKIS